MPLLPLPSRTFLFLLRRIHILFTNEQNSIVIVNFIAWYNTCSIQLGWEYLIQCRWMPCKNYKYMQRKMEEEKEETFSQRKRFINTRAKDWFQVRPFNNCIKCVSHYIIYHHITFIFPNIWAKNNQYHHFKSCSFFWNADKEKKAKKKSRKIRLQWKFKDKSI